mgnify:CR=1 FL=1
MSFPASDNLRAVWMLFTQGQESLTVRDYIFQSARLHKELSDPKHIIAAFNMIDGDCDGRVTFTEWRTFAQHVSATVTDDQALRIFRRLDLDHEGSIDLFDFGTSIRERPLFKALLHVMLATLRADTPEGKAAQKMMHDSATVCKWSPRIEH